MVWIFETYQRNVRDRKRMEFGLWSVVAKGYDVELAREIDESTFAAIDCSETSHMIEKVQQRW